ncbi:MAG TPA: helix-turn-helix domain-containing protein [Candidatus Onthousia faecavium]|nr:helix-turn-helix domain-containing protein [Candidatus Onthousia faecavium]
MNNKKIGEFIALLRKEKGLTQIELAEKLFVTDKAVSKWERGLSLPDITVLEKLALELDVKVEEILHGERENKKQKEERQVIKRDQKRQLILIALLISFTVVLMAFFIIFDYIKYHPSIIKIGNNDYKISNYVLEEKGLEKLQNIVEKSEKATAEYNVSYMEIEVNKNGKLENFTLTVNYFDNNMIYVGRGSYTYDDKNLTYSYTAKEDEKTLLVETYSKNNNIANISEKIKKIPLKEQIKLSELDNYYISYRPNTTLEWGTPIFDARDNKKITTLTKEDYNKGIGGKSDSGVFFAIRLNDGSSIASGQQYLYVFDSTLEDTPINPNYMMETDYYINNGKLQFTRDYGKTYIDADITEEDLEETLNFYGSLSLEENSWFLSTNNLIPIAYFYGEEPVLKISNDNGKTWSEHKFITSSETLGKEITRRVVGFTSQNFGYVLLGTDWTMGSGEIKKLYFTYDGGSSWEEIPLPLNGTSHVVYDFCMYDELVGVLVLRDTLEANFPLVYSTVSGGKTWNEVRYRDSNLPDEITFLSDVDRIEKDGDTYYIKMGQGDSGTLKATFRTGDMISWSFVKTSEENIHTVG